MKIKYAAKVAIGKKETNDDRILIAGKILREASEQGELELPAAAVLCDGCGGYRGGGVAAETVLETLAAESPESLGAENHLREILEKCNEKIAQKKFEQPEFSRMCTTVAGCVFLEKGIVLFHAGDSRIYRQDQYDLTPMTKDHSYVQKRIDEGELTEEEARFDPNRNIITRCMGGKCPPPDIRILKEPVELGDKYLLCSDGLWECVSPEQIFEILSGDASLEKMADLLIEKALEQGSDDNISVCICAAPEKPKEETAEPFVLD